jgi:hypothetical protein
VVSQVTQERAAALNMSLDQLEVLEHLGTYRVTTSEAVGQILKATPEAVKSFLQRLRAGGYIDSADMFGRTKYHFLTDAGLRVVGLPEKKKGSLNPNPLAEAFGMLRFCTADPSSRLKLRTREFRDRFPARAPKGMRCSNYYYDSHEEPGRIGFIYVDRGISVSKVVGKTRHMIIGPRFEHPEWRSSVLDRHLFAIGIATPTPEKAEQIRGVVTQDWPHIAFRFEVVPELLLIRDRRRNAAR